MSTNQRIAPVGLAVSSASHFKIAQNTSAVKKEDMA